MPVDLKMVAEEMEALVKLLPSKHEGEPCLGCLRGDLMSYIGLIKVFVREKEEYHG